ncbi:achaete-scute homolog 1a-like [Gigantopelta aegis]|uniref:achaete-scute homolog 1a-like n=1 Tax=Gigantopelta aegis TaxID=1735272 RepID=UPI001B88D414|nr:achaete-scute homolog 1a-like [Gigantopelta aegis]
MEADMLSLEVFCDGPNAFTSLPDRPSCMFSTPSPKMSSKKAYEMASKENCRELVHCKRRLDFSPQQSYLDFQRPPTIAVARRNERERNRVKLINTTFASLRDHLPHASKGSKAKKMSKVETLRAAIDYIRDLQSMIGDADSSLFDEHSKIKMALEQACGTISQDVTSPSTSVSSMSPSPKSSDSSYDVLAAEDDQLIDFVNWF